MGLNTYPSNPFPPSTDRMDADVLEAEVNKLESDVDQLKSGLNDVNSKLTSYTKLFETLDSGTYRDKINSMHATINALSYHDKVASFIDFKGTICRFNDISGTIYTYIGNYMSSGLLKTRAVAVDSQYSFIKLIDIGTTGTTVNDDNNVEDTSKFALYL